MLGGTNAGYHNVATIAIHDYFLKPMVNMRHMSKRPKTTLIKKWFADVIGESGFTGARLLELAERTSTQSVMRDTMNAHG